MPINSSPSSTPVSEIDIEIKERFAQLPKIIQDAIISADVQKQMRAVSENYKLHVDQWGKLEKEVMLTLLGFQEPIDLETNIQNEVGVTADIASGLAQGINKIVFEPIRAELERQLEHPEAKEKELTTTEAARAQILAGEKAASAPVSAPGVLPATPPAPPPTEKAVRAPISSSYSARQPSSERKIIEGDPYR